MTLSKRIFPILFILLLFSQISKARANENQEDFKAQTEIASYQDYLILNISLTFSEDLYTYAPNQVDVYPTKITFFQEEDIVINNDLANSDISILFPIGHYKPDPLNKKIKVRVFDEQENIYILFKNDNSNLKGELQLSFLACSELRCMPINLKLPLNLSETPKILEEQKWADDFLSLYQEKDNDRGIRLTKLIIDNLKNSNKPKLGIIDSNLEVSDNLGKLGNLRKNVNNQDKTFEYEFSPRTLDNSIEVSSLWKALLFGLIAGLILNIMPCVLPVVALKINVLFKIEHDKANKLKEFKEYCIFFSLGIIIWFMALGLLLGLLGYSWGQLFQSPSLVLGLMVFIFAMALSLFGLFHLPIINIRHNLNNAKQNNKVSAFMTGLLATLLATPCSGPLLGAVLGYSLTQSLPILLTIFLSMGIGMALPYLIFAIKPSLCKYMPSGGNWLNHLEHILGFFLIGTSIYLFSIIPNDWHTKSLLLLFTTTISVYIWGKWGSFHCSGLKKYLMGLTCLIIFILPINLFFEDDEQINYWENFEPKTFESLLGKETLLVQFSADWCPTCKVLEYTVLTEENLSDLAHEYDPTFIYVDLTDYDQTQQDFLQSLDSVSIPLVAIFPKGEMAKEPIIIRDIYTFSSLKQALEQAQVIPD